MTNNSRFNFRAFDKIGKKILPNVSLNFLNEVIESHHDDVWEVYEDIPPQFGGKDNICTLSFDDCEIMQWSGLTDKNGRDIFEGDIIEYTCQDGSILVEVINFVIKDASFLAEHKYGYGTTCRRTIFLTNERKQSKIIGNIYQNPELLEEQKSCE